MDEQERKLSEHEHQQLMQARAEREREQMEKLQREMIHQRAAAAAASSVGFISGIRPERPDAWTDLLLRAKRTFAGRMEVADMLMNPPLDENGDPAWSKPTKAEILALLEAGHGER